MREYSIQITHFPLHFYELTRLVGLTGRARKRIRIYTACAVDSSLPSRTPYRTWRGLGWLGEGNIQIKALQFV